MFIAPLFNEMELLGPYAEATPLTGAPQTNAEVDVAQEVDEMPMAAMTIVEQPRGAANFNIAVTSPVHEDPMKTDVAAAEEEEERRIEQEPREDQIPPVLELSSQEVKQPKQHPKLEDLQKPKDVNRIQCHEREEPQPFNAVFHVRKAASDAPFVTALAVFHYGNIVLLRTGNEEAGYTYIQTIPSTLMEGTATPIIQQTIQLGSTVRIYQTTRVTAIRSMKEKHLLRECHWVALSIQFAESDHFTWKEQRGYPVIGITTKHEDPTDPRVMLIAEQMDPFPMLDKCIPPRVKESMHMAGQMYEVTKYHLPPFLTWKMTEEGALVVDDQEARRRFREDGSLSHGPPGLVEPKNISPEEMECMRTHGTKGATTLFNPAKHLRSRYAAEARLRNEMDRQEALQRTVHDWIPTVSLEDGRFTAKLQVDAAWTKDTPSIEQTSWIPGANLYAKFRGHKTQTRILVNIRSVSTPNAEGKVTVVINFPTRFNCLINAWTRTPQPITVGPSDKEDKVTPKVITKGFKAFSSKAIFAQYNGHRRGKWNRTARRQQIPVGRHQPDVSQRKVIDEILHREGVVWAIAPPGTGKTMVTSICADAILRASKGTVAVAAPTNVAIANALEVISQEINPDGIRITRMSSRAAEQTATANERRFLLRSQLENYGTWLPVGTPDSDFNAVAMKVDYMQELQGKMEECQNPLELVDTIEEIGQIERDATAEFLRIYRPNLIGTTIPLLIRNANFDSLKDVTTLMVDGAAQLPAHQLLAALCALPKLSKIVLIGDPQQLGPYIPYPENSDIFKISAQSDMERLFRRFRTSTSVLNKIYRSHHLLTTNVISRLYPKSVAKVTSALGRDDNAGVRRTRMPEARDGTPCVFYHVQTPGEQGRSIEEATAIQQFLQKASSTTNPADFAVIVYHRRQKQLLSEMLPAAVPIHTVDAYQGQQARFVLISTVKNARSNAEPTVKAALRFVSDPKRTLVALTRATDGVFVFGNVNQLRKVGLYKTLIEGWAESAGAIIYQTQRKKGAAEGRQKESPFKISRNTRP